MKNKLLLVLSLMLVGLIVTPSHAAPELVGTDVANDWGRNLDPEAYPLGEALGQELVSASIDPDGAGTVRFVIGLKSLATGIPEATRYTWNALVNDKVVELDGKFTNYSRGTCDPTAGSCPPPRDPGLQPFIVRGNCSTNAANVTTCQEIGRVQAVFDTSAATITIPVPVSMISAEACATISAGVNLFGGSISAIPSAYFSSSAMPMDTMELEEHAVEAC